MAALFGRSCKNGRTRNAIHESGMGLRRGPWLRHGTSRRHGGAKEIVPQCDAIGKGNEARKSVRQPKAVEKRKRPEQTGAFLQSESSGKPKLNVTAWLVWLSEWLAWLQAFAQERHHP